MDHTVKNVLGPDLRIFETSGGNLSFSQYPEQAQVFGSNDLSSWTSLGIVKNDNNAPELGEVDLGSMSSAKYIKIVDKTTMTGSDGFDLDAITCLNQNQNWNEDVYYVDKQSQKLYEVKVVNNEVALKMVTKTKKKVQLGYNGTNLYMVESSGKNRLRQYNPSTNTWLNLGNADVKGRLSQAVVKNNKLIVNKESKHELVEFSLPSLRQTVLGKVFHNNSQVKLINGDLAYNEMGDLHMVTQFNGGQLFKLNRSNRGFEATLVASRLGKVTGLALLPDGDMLVSLSNSKKMKKVNLQTSQVVDLKLVGDLSKQGSSADLASE
jgi:WD40 repeat protein